MLSGCSSLGDTVMALSASELRELLHYDAKTGVFRWRVRCGQGKANAVAGTLTKDGYVQLRIRRVHYRAHRLAWLWVTGSWPVHQIDHCNGVRGDNRFENLRDVPQGINVQNQRRAQKKNKVGLLGVKRNGSGFRAAITVGGKESYLGTYSTPEIAHGVYVTAKRTLHQGCTI